MEILETLRSATRWMIRAYNESQINRSVCIVDLNDRKVYIVLLQVNIGDFSICAESDDDKKDQKLSNLLNYLTAQCITVVTVGMIITQPVELDTFNL